MINRRKDPTKPWEYGTCIPPEDRRHIYGGVPHVATIVRDTFARHFDAISDIEAVVQAITLRAWERLEPDPMGLAVSEAVYGILLHGREAAMLVIASLQSSLLIGGLETWLPGQLLDDDLPDCLAHLLIAQQEETFGVKRHELIAGEILGIFPQVLSGLRDEELRPEDTGYAIGYRPRAAVSAFIAAPIHGNDARLQIAFMIADIKRGMDAYQLAHPTTTEAGEYPLDSLLSALAGDS